MINLVFNILNFLVVSGALVFAFNKYLLPSYKQLFHEENLNINKLNQARVDLINRQQETDDEILEQDLECKNLKFKVEAWNNTIVKKRNIQESQLRRYNDLILEKLKVQTKRYNQKKQIEQIKPNLIKTLENDLKIYFENENNANKFLDSLINTKMGK